MFLLQWFGSCIVSYKMCKLNNHWLKADDCSARLRILNKPDALNGIVDFNFMKAKALRHLKIICRDRLNTCG